MMLTLPLHLEWAHRSAYDRRAAERFASANVPFFRAVYDQVPNRADAFKNST
jgi:hypothetical protein